MTTRSVRRLFGVLVPWTVLTSLFAWLPLVRILGRAEGYTWRILGLSGSGTEGPFWVFIPLTAYAVVVLWTLIRGPRPASHVLVTVWHLLVSGVIVAGVVQGGTEATMQGQGLRWEVPLWVLAVPFLLGTAIAIAWVVGDRRTAATPVAPAWSRRNSLRLGLSLSLLAAAFVLFAAGTNYDAITAVAILATIGHWIALVRAFGDVPSPGASE